MTERDFVTALAERLEHFEIAVDADLVTRCAAYLHLLGRWNKTINLTALPLAGSQLPSSIDKLIVEPLLAASVFPSGVRLWVDMGSGGGSPAIPLRLACPSGELVMVESRERKCAFLREAARTLGLLRTSVKNVRFEALQVFGDVDVVTIRAVRLDAALISLTVRMIHSGGTLIGFGAAPDDERFQEISSLPLPDGSRLSVSQLSDVVPRGTHLAGEP